MDRFCFTIKLVAIFISYFVVVFVFRGKEQQAFILWHKARLFLPTVVEHSLVLNISHTEEI